LRIAGAALAAVPCREPLQLPLRRQAPGDRLLSEAADVGAGGGDVEERSLDGGDAQAGAARGFLGREREAVEAEGFGVAAVRRRGQINGHDACQHLERDKCTRVREPRVVSAGEQRCNQPRSH
jgi:hypothetical protein